jgi:hypothetical protein
MILYVNGCSHTAAAEAVVPYCFAEDDPDLYHLGRRPHPMNLMASWAMELGRRTHLEVYMDAESASSNDRIDSTTRAWIENNLEKAKQSFMILQWTTWEREEWFHDGKFWQVNASGIDTVPADLEDQYKNYVINVDWDAKTLEAHEAIWNMHLYLKNLNIKHLFFSGHNTFSDIQQKYNWGKNYIEPYARDHSYHNWLINNGGNYVNPTSYHFDAESHCIWAQHVLKYINDNNLLGSHEISFN